MYLYESVRTGVCLVCPFMVGSRTCRYAGGGGNVKYIEKWPYLHIFNSRYDIKSWIFLHFRIFAM